MIPRPLRKKSIETLKAKVENYFTECEEQGKAAVFTGISYHLGISRLALGQWLAQKDHDQPTQRAKDLLTFIKSACRRLEMEYEQRLVESRGNVAGLKLSLTNNFAWRDKSDVELSTPKAAPELSPDQRQDLHEGLRIMAARKANRQRETALPKQAA